MPLDAEKTIQARMAVLHGCQDMLPRVHSEMSKLQMPARHAESVRDVGEQFGVVQASLPGLPFCWSLGAVTNAA